MSDLTALSEGLLAGIWRTSWQVGVLVALVLVIQALFARWLTPRWRYALWLLVVLRAFVPVVPQSHRTDVPGSEVAVGFLPPYDAKEPTLKIGSGFELPVPSIPTVKFVMPFVVAGAITAFKS